MRLSDEGGRCADKIGRRVARIIIADLDRVGRFFLHQPADQRLRGCLRTAPGRRMSDTRQRRGVVEVHVGTRDSRHEGAGRPSASRPLDALLEGQSTRGWRPWKWPQRRAAWQQSERYFWPGNYSRPHEVTDPHRHTPAACPGQVQAHTQSHAACTPDRTLELGSTPLF